MAAKENPAQRFMRATGKLRAIFGPANRSELTHERPDGSTYVVPKNPEDKSLR
jgi:hypothetical protein